MTAFVDSNVVLYATGKAPIPRDACLRILLNSAAASVQLATSAEVLQEVLYVRQRTLGREIARAAVELASNCLDAVPVLPEDILAASRMDAPASLEARDLVHLATMARLGITRIVSSDRAFDRASEIERLDPLEFDAWRERLFPTG